jgi:hypothetical protein
MENEEEEFILHITDVVELPKRILERAAQPNSERTWEEQQDSWNISKEMNDDISKQHGTSNSEQYLDNDTYGLDDVTLTSDKKRNWILKKILSHKLAIGLAAGLTTIGVIGLLWRRKF